MIAQINRTKIIRWISLRDFSKNQCYNGYAWKLLSIENAVFNDNREYKVYSYLFYDGECFHRNEIACGINEYPDPNDLAKEIIDFRIRK